MRALYQLQGARTMTCSHLEVELSTGAECCRSAEEQDRTDVNYFLRAPPARAHVLSCIHCMRTTKYMMYKQAHSALLLSLPRSRGSARRLVYSSVGGCTVFSCPQLGGLFESRTRAGRGCTKLVGPGEDWIRNGRGQGSALTQTLKSQVR